MRLCNRILKKMILEQMKWNKLIKSFINMRIIAYIKMKINKKSSDKLALEIMVLQHNLGILTVYKLRIKHKTGEF